MTAPSRPAPRPEATEPVLRPDVVTVLPTASLWQAFARTCFTCGASPVGRFPDGSPRYDHRHPPARL